MDNENASVVNGGRTSTKSANRKFRGLRGADVRQTKASGWFRSPLFFGSFLLGKQKK
jgi:hypothetical protein